MRILSLLNSCTKAFAFILAAAPVTAALHAQTAVRVKVAIPFGFEASTRHLPAGSYVVQFRDGHMLAFNGTGGSSFVFTVSDQDLKPNYQGRIIFHKCGGKYFLHEVWLPGQSTHVHMRTTQVEKDAQLASNEPAPTNVELAILEEPR